MGTLRRLAFPLALALFLAVLAACGGDDPPPSPSPSATATAAPSPTPSAALVPSGERILADVRTLAAVARPAGSEMETLAAENIAARLRNLGYEVEVREFALTGSAGQTAALTVRSSPQRTVASVPLTGSAPGTVEAQLVSGGRGTAAELAAARGAVVLMERGGATFGEKVANAEAAGARAVIIYNNEPGIFAGQLSQPASVPAVSVSQAEGQALLAALQSGSVSVQVGVSSPGASRNVVARPPGRECETVTGGHYDSVPQAVGANDNASGTATVLEIAAVIASKGEMAGNCFVLFGGEELGLRGSRAFVASLTVEQRRRIRAMLNFDMVGVGDEGWLLIGSPGLQQRAGQLTTSLGIPAASAGQVPNGAGSDQSSFLDAGIPALFFHRIQDNAWHTPDDVPGRVRADLLEQAARLGVALLESLNGS